jgi:hypothetical protein
VELGLRIKLWLGWLFGWDKGGIRAALLIISFWVVILSAECAYESLTSPKKSELCAAYPEHWLCTGILPSTPTDAEIKGTVESIIDEVRRESR